MGGGGGGAGEGKEEGEGKGWMMEKGGRESLEEDELVSAS